MRALPARVRSLLLLLWLVFAACERVGANAGLSNELAVRAGILDPDTSTSAGAGTTAATTSAAGTTTPPETTTTPPTTTTPATTTAQTTTTSDPPTTTTTSTPSPTTTSTDPTTTTSTPPATTSDPPTTTTDPPPEPTTQVAVTTNSDGQTVTVTTLFTPSADSVTSSSASPSSTSTSSDDDGGIKTSTIIGLSVAGGVAVLGVIGFVVWKFTRKRDFDDEPIKWPELNMHGENLNYALPTNRAENTGTGAGGATTGLDSSSEVNLTRDVSSGGYSHSQYSQPAAADSTADLYAPGSDPYAVPPLPHVNPNQPYRDDPTTYGAGYYDPYRGPVPHTFNDAASVDSHGHGAYGSEAIPMSNLTVGAGAAAGRRSPNPGVTYDPSAYAQTGRQSPAAGVAYSGRQSPGPGAALSGRQSPGAGVAYTGRQSPGPNAAYGGGY